MYNSSNIQFTENEMQLLNNQTKTITENRSLEADTAISYANDPEQNYTISK
jgi:hypothetical protein